MQRLRRTHTRKFGRTVMTCSETPSKSILVDAGKARAGVTCSIRSQGHAVATVMMHATVHLSAQICLKTHVQSLQ